MSASATFSKLSIWLRAGEAIAWSEFPAQPIESTYPRMWPLLALGITALLFNIFSATSHSSSDDALGFLGVALFLRMAATCYWLFCMFRLHRILADFSGRKYSISPGNAVFLQLIPLVAYYWSFHWTRAIATLVNQRTNKKMHSLVPGVALATASLLGVIGSLPSLQLLGTVRIFLLLATGRYLIRMLQCALPKPVPTAHNRLPQLKVAASVGIGSAFSLILVRAVDEFGHKKVDEVRPEILACLLVALGMVVFLEPAFEMLRERIGLAEHHDAHSLNRPWRLRLAAFAIIALPSISHTLLHQEVEAHFKDCFELLVAILLGSGGITYCWVTAARGQRSSAARSGLLAAILLGTLLFFAAPGVTVEAANPAQSSRVTDIESVAWPIIPATIMSEKVKFLAIVLPLLLAGLAGGFAIDRKRACCARNVALAIVGAAFASTLVLWAVDTPHEISRYLPYLPAGIGWALALVVGPSSEVFATHAQASPA